MALGRLCAECRKEPHLRFPSVYIALSLNSSPTARKGGISLSVVPVASPVDELERVDLRKMNLQLVASKENQHRAKGGKNEAGGMVSFVCRTRKHVGNGAAQDRSDDAEHDRPEDCHVHLH